MIRIKKFYDDLPSYLSNDENIKNIESEIETNRKEIEGLRKKHDGKFEDIKKIKIGSKKVYGGLILEMDYGNGSITKKLHQICDGRCVYCESIVSGGGYPEVEHYRGKARVTEDADHTGYYWLAYEWSNLLGICSKCNKRKSSSFPILGDRAESPSDRKGRRANGPTLQEELPNFSTLS